MAQEFFGEHDLFGNARMMEPHGKISIPLDGRIKYSVSPVYNSVDLVFNGLSGIEELIGRLTILRNDMIRLKGE